MRRVVVVGLGPAGLWSAISARVADPSAEVVVISDEKYLTYSRCGLPFVIGGEIGGFDELIITSIDKLKSLRIQVSLESKVVDVSGDEVIYEREGEVHRIKFSSLVIATGSKPFIPPIPGIDVSGVYSLKTIDDGLMISEAVRRARKALVIGAGAIGLEVAEALVRRGLEVVVAEIMPRVLPTILDGDMAKILGEAIRSSGVQLMLNSKVEEILGDSKVKCALVGGVEVPCDIVIVATGVRPNIELARKIGVSIGV
ncbi:MAG: pyridine nucleotide-disulfide oxidoreductase, partial [Candidatus Methanomethylicota archaeon]